LPSFIDAFRDALCGAHRTALRALFAKVANNASDTPLVMPHQIHEAFKETCATTASLSERSSVGRLIHKIQEAVCGFPVVAMACRVDMGVWQFILLNMDDMMVEEVSPASYLALKEKLAGNVASAINDQFVLEFDMRPFTKASPKVTLKSSIGNGVSHLNKTLTLQVFGNGDAGTGMGALLSWMQRFQSSKGHSLLLDEDIIDTVRKLRSALLFAVAAMTRMESEEAMDYTLIEPLGFLRGWGATVGGVRTSFGLLLDLIEAVDPATLEELLCRLPVIFRVAIISPHGFFGQDNVLGLPDSGGQIVYILDQVRALEAELTRRLHEAGLSDLHPDIVVITRLIPNSLGTACREQLEPLRGTNHGRILRVPFRSDDGEVLNDFISRFEIWPYLERFTIEATKELLAELGGELPEFIIGNYSDGNLAATLMRHEMKGSSDAHVCLATIAHALEKTKYSDADLHWDAVHYKPYNFGIQTTADLIAMSSSDFIVTSTFQEIAGTPSQVGQYESYQYFTLPKLYRVVDGIDVFDSKFNIVSPGCDASFYFPFRDETKRLDSAQDYIADLFYGDERANETVGRLVERKPIIFSMARLDAVKNLTGLASIYGNSPLLRERCNLIIIGGVRAW
jgi:sucrose synthase